MTPKRTLLWLGVTFVALVAAFDALHFAAVSTAPRRARYEQAERKCVNEEALRIEVDGHTYVCEPDGVPVEGRRAR